MTDRVYPSTKTTTNGTANPTAAPAANGTAGPAKPQLRHPYRTQPNYQRNRRYQRRRSGRSICCCCCFWTILVILAIALLAAIAGAALYVLYRPHRPQFSLSSLRIGLLNLTTSSDLSQSHISSRFNLTLSALNPNSHVTFFYDQFTISCYSGSVFIANGTVPAFTSGTKNETIFRPILVGSEDLDTQSVTSVRSDLKKKDGAPLRVQMDTKVKVKMGSVKSKRVGIRVTCDGFKGVVPPKGKTPAVATVSDAKCKVDLRIKIWKWTF